MGRVVDAVAACAMLKMDGSRWRRPRKYSEGMKNLEEADLLLLMKSLDSRMAVNSMGDWKTEDEVVERGDVLAKDCVRVVWTMM